MFIVHLNYYDVNLPQHDYISLALQFLKSERIWVIYSHLDLQYMWYIYVLLHSIMFVTPLRSCFSLKLIDVVIFTHASCMMKITRVEIGPIVHAHYIFHRQTNRKKNRTKNQWMEPSQGRQKGKAKKRPKDKQPTRIFKKGKNQSISW